MLSHNAQTDQEKLFLLSGVYIFIKIGKELFMIVILGLHFILTFVSQQFKESRRIHRLYVLLSFHSNSRMTKCNRFTTLDAFLEAVHWSNRGCPSTMST